MNKQQPSTTQLYVFRWNRMNRKGETCHVLARGKRNSCLIEFVRDGHKAVTSRNSLRKSSVSVCKEKHLDNEKHEQPTDPKPEPAPAPLPVPDDANPGGNPGSGGH